MLYLQEDILLRHYDKGSCKNKLGHSRASVIWHRTQVCIHLCMMVLKRSRTKITIVVFALVLIINSSQFSSLPYIIEIFSFDKLRLMKVVLCIDEVKYCYLKDLNERRGEIFDQCVRHFHQLSAVVPKPHHVISALPNQVVCECSQQQTMNHIAFAK